MSDSNSTLYKANIGDPAMPKLDLPELNEGQHLMVRSTNWLGDAVMTLPAVYGLRQLLKKNGLLIIVCSKKLRDFWTSFDWVDQVICFEGRRFDDNCRHEVMQLAPTMAVLLPNSLGSAWDIRRCGIKVRVGRGGRGRFAFVNYRIPAWKRIAGQDRHHQLREYLQIVSACGISPSLVAPAASPKIDEEHLVQLGIDLSRGNFLALTPGAAFGPAKQWPVDYYAAVAKWWKTEVGGEVLLLGAPGEEKVIEEVQSQAGCGLALAGKTSLKELMYLLGKARCVVANDSGGMHLAAAMGSDGVAVFGSTDPRATGPLGGRWHVLWDNIECAPCLKRTCEVEGRNYDCLRGVTPERVMACLKDLIK